MDSTGLLSLPTEVLDEIYGYLDWDSTKSLLPQRGDLFNISLVCERLRETIIPRLFRTVTFRLRFADGTLVEPEILSLRWQRPDLAKHIRCVVIHPEYQSMETPLTHQDFYGSQAEIEQQWELVERRYKNPEVAQPLILPGSVSDVASFVSLHCELEGHCDPFLGRAVGLLDGLTSELAACEREGHMRWSQKKQELHLSKLLENQRALKNEALELARKRRENQRLGKLSTAAWRSGGDDSPTYPERMTDASVRHVTIARESGRSVIKLQRRQDALALAMACIPTTVDHLFLNAFPPDLPDRRYQYEHNLVIVLMAAATELFGPQLRTLTNSSWYGPRRSSDFGIPQREPFEASCLTDAVASNLPLLKTLRLGVESTNLKQEMSHDVVRWESTKEAITRLEIWGYRCQIDEIIAVLAKFPHIAAVQLCSLTIGLTGSHLGATRINPPLNDAPSLMKLAAEVRNLLRTAQIQIRDLRISRDLRDKAHTPTAGEYRFVESEVINRHEGVEEARRETLSRDCESFLPLWAAEEADCMDKQAQARSFGRLVDAALSSRF